MSQMRRRRVRRRRNQSSYSDEELVMLYYRRELVLRLQLITRRNVLNIRNNLPVVSTRRPNSG